MVDDSLDIRRLVAEHHQAVYRYAYRLTGSVAEAEDLTQQVYLIAQQKWPQLRDAANARSWLFAILRHVFLKGRRRRKPISAGDIELNVDTIPAEIPSAEAIDREQLQRALDDLPEHYRLVVAMFYYEELPYRKIAETLGLPIGTVMSRLARAKALLRSYLFEPQLGRHRPTDKRG